MTVAIGHTVTSGKHDNSRDSSNDIYAVDGI